MFSMIQTKQFSAKTHPFGFGSITSRNDASLRLTSAHGKTGA
jgi:hypothetical protein